MRRLFPILAGWSARALVIVCGLLNTRLLMDLVGIEGFAAISIVMSLAPWLALLNLGIPNSAQNLIAQRRAKGHLPGRIQRAAVDTACSLGLLYVLPAMGLALAVDQLLLPNHEALSLSSVTLLVWTLVMLGLTTVFHQVLHALHASTWPVVAPAVQAGLTSLLLLMARVVPGTCNISASLLGVIATALPILIVFGLSAAIVRARLRARIDLRALRRLLYAGRGFLIFGLTGALALSCDYVVMSRLLSSTAVAEYNLASKTFGTVLTLHAVLLAASWTPLSDTFFRGDTAGMRRLLLRLLGMGALLVLLTGVPLLLGMNRVVSLLTGGRVAELPLSLSLGWLGYIAMRVWSDTFATALLSCNQTAAMNRYLVWQSIISLSAQWLLGTHFGASGIVLGILCSFLLTAAWILPLRFRSITRAGAPANSQPA